MLELLPQENRKKITTEYIFRISNIALVLLFVVQLCLFFLFTPSFFWTKYRNENLAMQLNTLSFRPNDAENPTNLIHNLNGFIKALSNGRKPLLTISDSINTLISIQGKGIKIYSMNIIQKDPTTESFSISGIADTRNDLIAFQSRLKQTSGFQNIVLPVSSIIKNTNADFTITFTITK